MGNQETTIKNKDVQIQLNHSKMNRIKVINENKTRYMQAVFGTEQHDYDTWKDQLKKVKLNSQYLLLPNNHDFSSKALCGTTGTAKVNYDNYPYLLIEEIENRRAKKKRFDETQLWKLLYCLINGHKQMRAVNNSNIGDVRPDNIFLNESGNIKISNLLSWPKGQSNYQKFLENQISYLAPEDLKLIQTQALDNSVNTQSQIFSIGLTVLSSANLKSFNYLYNTKSSQFNLEEFAKVGQGWRLHEMYSDIFKATISSLIQVDVNSRLSSQQLQPWIQKYSQQILAGKNFLITDPPQKILNQINIMKKSYESIHSFNQPHYMPSIHNFRPVSGPHVIQGERRLIQQKRLPPVSVIPGTNSAESIYQPVGGNSLYGYQGISSLHQNSSLAESTYAKLLLQGVPTKPGGYNSITYVPRTSLDSNQNPGNNAINQSNDPNQEHSSENVHEEKGNNNQPQISEGH